MNKNSDFADKLLAYYDAHRRILPWRENPLPYYVWVSEIMLQQTRVDTVIEYFQRFISRLPDIASLAGADQEELLKLWEGLGYYSRVRNMHKAALIIMAQYQGELPRDTKSLETLPGIGSYTAGAIASIAYQQVATAVDGNMLRVMSRVLAYDGDVTKSAGKKYITEALQQVISRERPGDFNQAMMDVGATVCIPNGQPLCSVCPLSFQCQAFKQGDMLSYPTLPEKKSRKKSAYTVLLIFCNDRIALEKRPAQGVLAGLWQFPMTEPLLDSKKAESFLKDEYSIVPVGISKGIDARHIFTHLEWDMNSYLVEVSEESERWQWFDIVGMESLSIPSAFKKFRDEAGDVLRSQPQAVAENEKNY